MNYRPLGRTGVLVSPLCLGAMNFGGPTDCLLYTSDAADERSSVDLGGRRFLKKKKRKKS